MKKSLAIRAKTSLQAFYILALKTVFVSNVFSTITLYHSSFEFARGFDIIIYVPLHSPLS